MDDSEYLKRLAAATDYMKARALAELCELMAKHGGTVWETRAKDTRALAHKLQRS